MNTVELASALKANIHHQIDLATQVQCGKNIDTLIEEVSKTNFDTLAKENLKETKDRKNDSRIRYWFTVTTLAVSAFAVICAVASIIFSAGLFSAGVQTLAIVTGFVGVTTAFSLFDNAVHRYLNYDIEQKNKKTIIGKLEKKFDNIKSLIQSRIKSLVSISAEEIKLLRASEILSQVNRVNTLVEKIKLQVPEKIIYFSAIDASPLLQFTEAS